MDPIPMKYSKILPYLIQNSLVVPKYRMPPLQPFPPWYDPYVDYKYHVGSAEHSIKDCNAFKAKLS